jgi:crossover junction endodeoxyribonuclease RuvC
VVHFSNTPEWELSCKPPLEINELLGRTGSWTRTLLPKIETIYSGNGSRLNHCCLTPIRQRRSVIPLCKQAHSGRIGAVGITPQQFEQLQSRLATNGRRRVEPACPPQSRPSAAASHTIILGVDPSLRGTGFGVIRVAKPHPVALAYGTIDCPAAWEHSRCLVKICQALREVIQQHRPTGCAMEGLFHAHNLQTALIMGQARGASMVAAGEAGLEIYEIAPRKMKQAIVGYGAAQKLAVAKMVQRMLRIEELPDADAADALALALAFAQETSRFSLAPRRRI